MTAPTLTTKLDREAPDAKTRQMAQKSIAEQNKSIGELQAMLRSMSKRPQ